MELPSEIQELIDSYDDNCREIENQAVDILCAVEHPIFGFLRDLTAQKSYFVLSRLRDWFGTTPTKQHCLCLMTLTDYISCSYNNTDFYSTFIKEKQDKFYESFFTKLSHEWKMLFSKMPFAVLPVDQFTSLKSSLQASIARFSNKFKFKALLSDIMTSCDEYGSKLDKYLSDLKVAQNFKIGVNISKNSIPISTKCYVRMTYDSKSTPIPVPFKVIPTPETSNAVHDLIKHQVVKSHAVPSIQLTQESKKGDFNTYLPKEKVGLPSVITIDDSPVKTDKTSLKLDNITNTVSSKAFKRPATPCVIHKPLNLDAKVMKCQNDVTIPNNVTKATSQIKLNAFDIMMRRKSINVIP